MEFIRQDNTVFPTTGDNACHMVSKAITNVNLPDTATFDGPPGDTPDSDTFRVQLTNFQEQPNCTIKLQVLRGYNSEYSHDFGLVGSLVDNINICRTTEHVRLVSNPKDDEYLDHQTPIVKLGDTVRATLMLNGEWAYCIELPVGRPPEEDGDKAIRTADVNFITIQGVNSAPETTINRISEDWAQCAVRFNLKSKSTITPVQNMVSIGGTATENGILGCDITPAGGNAIHVEAEITSGDNAEQMAQKLVTAISAHQGLAATKEKFTDRFFVMVNKGTNVTFQNSIKPAGVEFGLPVFNLNDFLDALEAFILVCNFRDNDDATIEMFAIDTPYIFVKDNSGVAFGEKIPTDTIKIPALINTTFLKETAVDADDTDDPFCAGHEIGHILFDGDDHSTIPTNLFKAPASTTEGYDKTKRLTSDQNTDARNDSGPNAVPAILKKK